ncbi:MAG: hypothetical protein ABFS86_07815 [Planctomycetota bacterium]
MTQTTEPLWLSIERKIHGLSDGDLSGDSREATIQRVAGELDGAGENVTKHGGHMLQLRWAVEARCEVGHSFMQDFDATVGALALDDVENTSLATTNVIATVGGTWAALKDVDRRPDVKAIVEATRLDLLIAHAKTLEGDLGVRYLYEAEVDPAVVIEALGIDQARYDEVKAAVDAERAEVARVEALVEGLGDKSEEDRVKALFGENVADDLIVSIGGIDAGTVETVRQAMEAELAEQKRLAEEEAARKAAEAAGPSLDDIPADEMLEHIESIREILEFSDVEAEIRTMCEQSQLPSALIDIAATDAGKLDELEAKAEG